MARIDSPSLRKITINLLNDIFFEIPHFGRFVPRLDALMSPSRVIVNYSVDSVSVYFGAKEVLNENCFLGTSCRQLDWQLSFVTQIFSQLSPLLSSVHSLSIHSGDELPTGEEDVDSTQWLELFRPFTQVTEVYVWRKLVPSIVQALATEDMTAEILPELTLLHLAQYRSSLSMVKAAEQFVAMRRLSGHTISLTSGDEVYRFLLLYYYTVQLMPTGFSSCCPCFPHHPCFP